MDGLNHLFWLVLFVALGFPVALGLDLFLRGRRRKPRAPSAVHHADEFMPLPADSGIARRMREPAHAAMPEHD